MTYLKHSALLLISLASLVTHADDVDIYISEDIDIDPPNVLFILDTSGSMNFNSVNGQYYAGSSETRMDVLKSSLFSTLEKTQNVNIGLMRFSSNSNGGYLSKRINDIDSVKNSIKSQVNNFDSYGGTPISETLYEAYKYFYGKYANYSINNATYFTNTHSYYWDSGYNTYARQTNRIDTSAYNNSQKYISPIEDKCQSNNIILFTDGEASADTSRDYDIRNLISNSDIEDSLFDSSKGLTKNCSGNGQCAEELALYMRENPHTIQDSNGKTVTARPVKTYTIGGFFPDGSPTIKYLENLAEAGGGIFQKANDATSLSDVLIETFEKISADTVSYSAPALSINAFNSFEHSEHIYFSIFEPSTKAQWNGNLKKYKLNSDGKILDAANKEAVDPNTSLFKKTAKSYWSNEVDGNFVTKGGSASKFSATRSLYSYLHDVATPKFPSNTFSLIDLTDEAYEVSKSNNKIKSHSDHLDIANTSINKNDLLDWVSGEDNNYMADALHGNALILNYGKLKEDVDPTGGSTSYAKSEDPIIFTATNAGILHAIDAETGNEEYAFIPQQLLKTQKDLYENRDSKNKVYGLDGALTSWFHDYNNDDLLYKNASVQESKAGNDSTRDLDSNNEFYQIYLGMRRGGHSYFSFDVTERLNPKLAWQINGNDPDLTTTLGFEELGQTWSEMSLGQIMHNNKKTPVLFFTGGYDTYYDPKSDGTTNPFSPLVNSANKEIINGNAVYIVHAKTGQLLWKATGRQNTPSIPNATTVYIPEMKDAFPSNVTTIDIDNDNLIDMFYVMDIKGKIWRFSIDTTYDSNKAPTKTVIHNHLFADVASSTNPSGSSKRYFYHSLDATKISTKFGSFVAISLVSGSNANPLEKVHDNYFFTLRDTVLTSDIDVSGFDATKLKTITLADLLDITIFDYNASDQNETLYRKYVTAPGLKLKLVHSGEKGLAKPLVFGTAVLFTTFTPKDNSATTSEPQQCTGSVDLGTGRLYRLNILTGGSLIKKDGSNLTRITELKREDIPVTPSVIFPPKGDDDDDTGCTGGPLIFVGTELIGESECVQSTQKLQWHEL